MTTFELTQWLRAEIAVQGRSRRDVGAAAGVDHSVVTKILNGQSDPRFSTASQLCDALGFELRAERRIAA